MASAIHNILNSLYAYVAATNVFRFQETNPLSAQYVSEQLVYSAALAAGTTFYYPSAAGAAMAGYKDASFDFYVLGVGAVNCTMTVQATSDDVTPNWHDVTMAGYEETVDATGAASFIGTPALAAQGILDFDEWNVKLWRVVVVTGAAANCTARIWARRKAL